MTVTELILILEKFEPDTEVRFNVDNAVDGFITDVDWVVENDRDYLLITDYK
jgi:hypothetical protein